MYVGKHEKIDYEKLLKEYEKNQEVESVRGVLKYMVAGIIITIIVVLVAFLICACILAGRS